MMMMIIKSNYYASCLQKKNISYDIWNKVSNSIKKELDCQPICNKIFLKTKTRSYGDETTDFHTRKLPEAGYNYICWWVKRN